MKMRKRILSFLLCLLLVCCIIPLLASAVELSYWEETLNQTFTVGRFKSKTITYSYQKLNTDPTFLFNDAVVYARNQWSNALGINLQYQLLMNGAQIQVYGGTSEELRAIGYHIANHDDMIDRVIPAKVTSTKRSMNYTFRGRSVDVHEITGAKMFVVDEDNKQHTLPEPLREKKTALHQMGHSLGWFGHSGSYDMTMYRRCASSDRNHINLHTYDIRHLKQIYDIANF